MSSKCSEFNELLLDLAYDELDEVSTARLLEHKNHCSACRDAYAEIMGVRSVAKSLDAPQIPSHFDAHILTLARETAQSFKENAKEHSIHPPVDTTAPVSILHRIQQVVFKSPVFGLGLAAAAVLVAAISLKDGQHTKMLEPMGDEPFVGATKDAEKEQLAQSPDPTTVDAASAAAVRPQIQKAGPNYQPATPADRMEDMKEARIESHSEKSAKRSNALAEPAPKQKVALDSIMKNPADLLGKEEFAAGAGAANAKNPSMSPGRISTPTADSSKTSMQSPASSKLMSKVTADPYADMAAEEMEADLSDDDEGSSFEAGLAAYNRGDCKNAVKIFQQMLDSQSGPTGSNATATHYIAKCEKRTGHCGQALISYEQLLTQYYGYSKRDEVLYEAAVCHQKLGHRERATELLEELALDPAWKAKADEAMKE